MDYRVTPYQETPAGKGTDWTTSVGNALGASVVGGYVKPFQEQRPSGGNIGADIPTPNPTARPILGMPNAQDLINQLNAAKQQARMAALGKSRDAALSNLGQEKAGIQPKYYDARNQVSAGAQQQARNFAEFMAQRGGASSGANAQATLANNMATQGNLGSLGRQETQAYTDIGRRTSDVQNAYESDVASAAAGGEADKMNALLNDYYQQQQRELQIAGLTGMLGGQQTLAAKSQDQNYGLNLAGLSGQLPGGGQTQQAQAQGFNQNMANKQFAYQSVQDAIKNGMSQQQIDNQAKQFAQTLGYNYDNMNANDKQAWAQIAVSQQNANTSAGNLSWSRDPNNPDNQYKQAQLDQLKNGSSAELGKELDGLYTGLTSGQIQSGAAIDEINLKLKNGMLKPLEASRMLALVQSISSSQPTSAMPKPNQAQIDSSGGTNPQDLNSTQLEQIWKTDSTGQPAGRPLMDWSQWYRDPRGRLGGVSYESWHQVYGPQLKAR